MKKALGLLLLVCFLGSSSYLKASIHFCGDMVTAIGLGDFEEEPCSCSEIGDMECCSDVQIKALELSEAFCNDQGIRLSPPSLKAFAVTVEPILALGFSARHYSPNDEPHLFKPPANRSLANMGVFRI